MKRVIFVFALVAMTFGTMVSCTPDSLTENDIQQVDPDEVEDPGDRGNG